MKHNNGGLIYSNVQIRPDRAYIMFVGDVKYIDTTTLLSKALSKRYGKPIETINVLPNMPSPYMEGNFIVVNEVLAEHMTRNGNGRYNLPLDQTDINREVSNNPHVKRVMDDILKSQPELYINLFKSTPEMTLTEDERIRVIGPSSDLFDYFDDKTNQRRIMEQLGIPIPTGYITESFDELLKVYKEKFGGNAFVTCANGFGGNGTEVVSSLDDIVNSNRLKGKDKFIMSELLKLVSSPSSLGIAANENEVVVTSITDQILNGVDYAGTIYPCSAPETHLKKMEEYTKKIGRFLGKSGYRGFFGVDFMINKEGNLYFVEINPRKIGSSPEIILAHRTKNPGRVSLPELEFLAVTEGTFGENFPDYQMFPEMNWGVLSIKAKEGQKTANYIGRDKLEREIFRNSGVTVLDHPGENIVYLGEGRLARPVCVVNDNPIENPREHIIQRLEEQKRQIKLIAA